MAIYAGTGTPGRVYRYGGGTDWTLISGDLDKVVLCLCVYNGSLFAGTSTGVRGDFVRVGYLYKYAGGTTWDQVGSAFDEMVSSLVIHNGKLHIGVGTSGMKVYQLDGDNISSVYDQGGDTRGCRAMLSHENNLYQGDWLYDIIYQDGDIVLDPNVTGSWGSCIWDFAYHDGVIYAGAYRGTYWYGLGTSWNKYHGSPFTDPGVADQDIWAVDSFKGDIYFGSLSLYKSLSYDHVMTASDGQVLSLVNDGNTMYIGTGGELGYWDKSGIGRVYSYTGSGSPTLISGALDTGVQCLTLDGWNIWVKKSGAWQPVTDIWARKGGAWQPVSSVDVNKDGWKPI